MRISDWSSDVCSSDLGRQCPRSEICRQVGSSDQCGDELRTVVDVSEKTACIGRATTPWQLVGRREIAEADIFDAFAKGFAVKVGACRSEEHTSELQSLMRKAYTVLCLKKKKKQ